MIFQTDADLRSSQHAQTETEPSRPSLITQSEAEAVPRSSRVPVNPSPLVPLFSSRHISSWGRFSRRRSFEPADRAPRPFLWQRAPWRTGTAPAQTHRTRSPSSRWPTAAAWRWTPLWAAFSHWSSLSGISFLWWQGKLIRCLQIRALQLSRQHVQGAGPIF